MTLLWILEDDEKLCDLLAGLCADVGWMLTPYTTPRGLEQALKTSTPDLLLLDQMLPVKSGVDVLSSLRNQGFSFPVLMLSALGAPSDRIAGLEAGADDYMSKPFLFRELQLRIEGLLRKTEAIPSLGQARNGAYQLGPVRFDPQRLELVGSSGSPVAISRGDAALLLALCQRPGQTLNRERLAWATGSLVDPSRSRTIDMRLSRLRRQLIAVGDGTDLVECLRGEGYQLRVAAVPLSEPA